MPVPSVCTLFLAGRGRTPSGGVHVDDTQAGVVLLGERHRVEIRLVGVSREIGRVEDFLYMDHRFPPTSARRGDSRNPDRPYIRHARTSSRLGRKASRCRNHPLFMVAVWRGSAKPCLVTAGLSASAFRWHRSGELVCAIWPAPAVPGG